MKLRGLRCHNRSCLDTDDGPSVPRSVAEAAEVSPGDRDVAGMSLPTLAVLAMGLLTAPLIQALHLGDFGRRSPNEDRRCLGCASQLCLPKRGVPSTCPVHHRDVECSTSGSWDASSLRFRFESWSLREMSASLLLTLTSCGAQRCDCGYDLTAWVLSAEADFCKGSN